MFRAGMVGGVSLRVAGMLAVNCLSFLLEAGLFESKIRIRYACVHLERWG
jgi:hypothetical protein